MSRTWSILLIFLFASSLTLHAQVNIPSEERPDAPPIDSEWIDFPTTVYTKGDKTFNITLGLMIPTYFSGIDGQGHGLSLGGTGSLGFNYFLTPYIFLGGEFGGMFAGTRGGNMLYIIPFGVRAGYQFIFGRFEVPLSLLVGAAPQRYIEESYFGLILKPGASLFWRFNPEWSFGLNTLWWFLPQWPANGKNSNGNFLEVTLTARYHF